MTNKIPPSVAEFSVEQLAQTGDTDTTDAIMARQAELIRLQAAEIAALKRDGDGTDERAAFEAGVKAASDHVKSMVNDYDRRHGSTDPDTGTREYPGDGNEWVGQMMELVEDFTGIACPKEWQARARLNASRDGVAVPEGWRLIENKTCYSLTCGGQVIATLAGPAAKENAALIVALLAAPTPAPAHSADDGMVRVPRESLPAHAGVLAERQRQITAEGWTPEHDDHHTYGEIADAAACYALWAGGTAPHNFAQWWPWDREWLKFGSPREMLVKSGALILAEIERIDRALLAGGAQ